MFLPLFNGARVVYLETLNTTELLRALQERDITAFCVVPQFFYLIHEKIFKELNKRGKLTLRLVRTLMALNRTLRRLGVNAGKVFFGKIHATFGPHMRYLVTGGSRFDPAIARDLYSFGIDVLNAYGLTETTGGAFSQPSREHCIRFGRASPSLESRRGSWTPKPSKKARRRWRRDRHSRRDRHERILESPRGHRRCFSRWLVLHRRSRLLRFRRKSFHHRATQRSDRARQGKNVYPEEIEAHYLHAYVKEICVMAMEARPGDPTSERLHGVIVPNFELLRERKIVNAKEVIRFDIEALSHKIASTKRLGSYDIWQEDLPRTPRASQSASRSKSGSASCNRSKAGRRP